MEYKTLKNGMKLPMLGLGVYKSTPGEETCNAVRQAIEVGYEHIDTATLYDNEKDVGKGVKQSGVDRSKLVLVTKLWPSDFKNAREVFFKSLKYLDTDYLDMYLLHWPHADANLRYKAYEACLKLMQEGYIKAVGVSNFLSEQLEDLENEFHVIPAVNQIELHPWFQQREVCEYCKGKEIGITAWGPIFHGYLSDEPLVFEIGEKYSKTAAQVTLRWHLEKGYLTIPKSVKKERLIENISIFDFSLDQEDIERIDALDGKRRFSFDSKTFDGDVTKARENK